MLASQTLLHAPDAGPARQAVADGYAAMDAVFSAILGSFAVKRPYSHEVKLNKVRQACLDILDIESKPFDPAASGVGVGAAWDEIEAEQARGSTFGLPDVFLPKLGHEPIFLELKLGKSKSVRGAEKLAYRVRPDQRATTRRLLRCGVCTGLLVGRQGTSELYVLRPTVEAMSGTINLSKMLQFGSATRIYKIDHVYLISFLKG